MSYGFKFKNNNQELVIDDRNVKPWIFSGSYVGLNYSTVDVSFNGMDFTSITDPSYGFRNEGAPETWRVYLIKYVAPTNANCFVAFQIPDTFNQNIWYSPTFNGPVAMAGSAMEYIPQLGELGRYSAIYALVPESWLATASQEALIAALPKPYFFSADAIPVPGTGYGVQVFKEDSTCMFDSNKKHIKLDSFSYAFVEVPNYAGSYGPYLPGTHARKAYTISGSSGNNLAFVLPEAMSSVFYSGQYYNNGVLTDYRYFTQSKVWYQKSGNTLYSINPDTSRNIVSPDTYGYSNLVSGARYDVGTEVTGSLSDTNLFDAAGRHLYNRLLILDVAGFDSPYTPTEFPAGYVLTNDDSSDIYEGGANPTYYKDHVRITLTTYNIANNTQVAYTISGSGITAADILIAYDINRSSTVPISSPTNSYFTVLNNRAYLDIFFTDDTTIEGNETMTLSLTNGKASTSLVIREAKTYSLSLISTPVNSSNNSFNEGSTVYFRLTTKNVANGTVVPFEIVTSTTELNAADFTNSSMAGSFTVSTPTNSVTGTATSSITLTNDMLTEGEEAFYIWIRMGTSSFALASLQITVNDTSAPTGYALRYGSQTGGNIQANEGDTLTFTIVGTNVPNGTRVYPAFANSTFDVADFIVPTSWYDPAVGLTGVVINNNTATFSFTIKNDLLTEGVEAGELRLLSTPDNTRFDNILISWFNGRIFIYDTSVSANYTLTSYINTVNEGQTFQLDATVDRDINQTTYWRITGVDTSDIASIYQSSLVYDYDYGYYAIQWNAIAVSLSGSFTFDNNNGTFGKSFLITMRNDQALEGTETLGFTLRTDSSSGTIVASKSITINDTSKPTYAIYNDTNPDNPNYISEGGSVRWLVYTGGVPNGTLLYWTNTGTTNAADFNDAYGNTNYGSVLIMNNSGWFERTLRNDLVTEGTETITMELRTGGNFSDGVLVTTAETVYVSDTSQTPTASISPNTSSVNEGGTVYWTVTTTNVPDGTYLYWTNTGSTTAADFTDNNNFSSVQIFGDMGSFSRTLVNDLSSEGPETIVMQIRSGGNFSDGVLLATSSTVTVNDTSLTQRNEIFTVTPSSVQYPSGVSVTCTGGTPSGTIYWSLNQQTYDQVLYFDANGYISSGPAATSTAGAGLAAGYYTLYFYFPETGHYRQASWTVTAANPAAGTLLSTFCSGTTKYGTYADGSGGSYNQVIASNSTDCGYVAPSGPTTSNYSSATNDNGNVDLWGSPAAAYDGMRCNGVQRNSIDVYVSRTFTLNQAATITAYLHVSSEANYDYGEMYFDGVMYARGSGTYESGAISGPISAGTHTVKCRYTKDGSVSGGTDTAFVEYMIT